MTLQAHKQVAIHLTDNAASNSGLDSILEDCESAHMSNSHSLASLLGDKVNLHFAIVAMIWDTFIPNTFDCFFDSCHDWCYNVLTKNCEHQASICLLGCHANEFKRWETTAGGASASKFELCRISNTTKRMFWRVRNHV
jgi:hypothetical protein